MKTYFVPALGLCQWLICLTCCAYEPPFLAGMSTEAAQTIMNDKSTDKRRFLIGVLDSKRLDLIQLCSIDNEYAVELLKAVSEMPESVYREHLMLILLQSPATIWPSDSSTYSDTPAKAREVEDPWSRIYEPVVKKYLPNLDTRFGVELIGSETRKKLAESIIIEMNKAHVEPMDWHSPPDSNASGPKPKVRPELKEANEKLLIAGDREAASLVQPPWHYSGSTQVWIVGLLAVLGLLAWRIKGKQ